MTSDQNAGCEVPDASDPLAAPPCDGINKPQTDPAPHSEIQLIQQLRRRDPNAMNTLIDQHGPRLHRTIGRLMAWSQDVEDVLQEVLLKAWQKIDSYREEGRFEDWLVSLAFHRARDQQRSLRRRLSHWIRYAQQSSHYGQHHGQYAMCSKNSGDIVHDEQWYEIQTAIQLLSPGDREILVMIHLENWSHERLAQHMNIPLNRLHVRLHRARQRLKSILNPSSIHHEAHRS
jgi:RNA polymerase sigma-70 factor (ECF subfamily)